MFPVCTVILNIDAGDDLRIDLSTSLIVAGHPTIPRR